MAGRGGYLGGSTIIRTNRHLRKGKPKRRLGALDAWVADYHEAKSKEGLDRHAGATRDSKPSSPRKPIREKCSDDLELDSLEAALKKKWKLHEAAPITGKSKRRDKPTK